jgi:hypothetical protein
VIPTLADWKWLAGVFVHPRGEDDRNV